ncbi:MAG: tRNA preQ1(34) S-adenosylmethionine ribosyltransferase-isomerase QueA [bacterium]|nr:tRNA preQ1(34) S-adenosylmethionine ribosyltransferase-isomerase QueA [bacterium]
MLNYDFELPPELIAQRPVAGRDASRLLLVERGSGALADARFTDLPGLLRAGDLLVVNNTRVLAARFLGRKLNSDIRAEVLLHSPGADDTWQALVRPSRRFQPGDKFVAGARDEILISVDERTGDGSRWVSLRDPATWEEAMRLAGHVPLPPYIDRPADERDSTEYQTLFADPRGAVAAPTAGLHFSRRVLDEIAALGVNRAELTLHVGIGTFQPMREDDPDKHPMHSESFYLPAAVRRAVDETRAAGGRVVAVGTTSTRALESLSEEEWDSPDDHTGDTRLFIRPPYDFKRVDALLTNFHLPRSTLLMLVSAFAGREKMLAAYRHAVADAYRFYSYGDAMLIMNGIVGAGGGG